MTRPLLRAIGELLRGLLAFPANRGTTARAVEERYRRPRRCC